MMDRIKRMVALAAPLLLAMLIAACEPSGGGDPLPRREPGGAPGVEQFTFAVAAYTADGRGIGVPTTFTLATIAADRGDVPIEGEQSGVNSVTVPNKITPYGVEAAMGPDLIAVSISVVAGLQVGERLACWVETASGQVVPGSARETTLYASDAEVGNVGIATVECLYP